MTGGKRTFQTAGGNGASPTAGRPQPAADEVKGPILVRGVPKPIRHYVFDEKGEVISETTVDAKIEADRERMRIVIGRRMYEIPTDLVLARLKDGGVI